MKAASISLWSGGSKTRSSTWPRSSRRCSVAEHPAGGMFDRGGREAALCSFGSGEFTCHRAGYLEIVWRGPGAAW